MTCTLILPQQRKRSRTTEPCRSSNQARPRGFADDDLGDVVRLRKADHVVGDAAVAAGNGDRLSAQGLRQAKRVGDAVALLLGELQAALGLDIKRRPGGVQTIRQALGIAYQPCGARVFADTDEQALARGPGTRDGTRLHLVEKLLVDALCRAPERELAESGEIGRRKEVLERALGLLRDVDLSLFEALDQVVGGEIDKLDGVGAIEDRVQVRSPARGHR